MNFWSSNGPNGGMVRWMTIDPSSPSIVYVAVNRTVYKSTNSGTTWYYSGSGILERGTVWQLIIDHTDPSILYLATDDSLYKTTDGGDYWFVVNNGIPSRFIRCVTMDPVDNSILYCGTGDVCLFKSTDGGENWAQSDSGITSSFAYSIIVDPVSSNIVYAATGDGTFKSTDSGLTWNNTGPDSPIRALQIDPVTPTTLYGVTLDAVKKSTDSGTNWFDVGLTGLDFWNITIDPLSPSTIYVGTVNEGGLYKSIDDGTTWNQIGTDVPNPHLHFVAVDLNSNSTIYLGTLGNGVYKSIDGGNIFSFMSEGLVKDDVRSIAVDPTNDDIVYATAQWGAFKTTDGGLSWSASIFRHGVQGMGDIVVDPFLSQNLYLSYGPVVASDGPIFKSTDAGDTWFSASSGISLLGGGITCFEAVPSAQNYLYANALKMIYVWDTCALYRTTNGGSSWVAKNLNHSVVAFAFHPTDSDILYAACRNSMSTWGGVFKTTDGGNTWFEKDNGIPNNLYLSLVIDPQNPEILYAGMEGWRDDEIYKTTNGGDSWSPSSNGLPSDGHIECLAIDPQTPQNLYAGLMWDEGVYHSTDGGANWTAMNDSLPPLSYLDVDAIAVSSSSPENIFCGLHGRRDQGGGVWKYTVDPTSINETAENNQFVTMDIYPNPARSHVVVQMIWTKEIANILEQSKVSLKIYDVGGRTIRTVLDNKRMQLGKYTVEWNGNDDTGRAVPAGVYFYQLDAGNFSQTQKFVLLR